MQELHSEEEGLPELRFGAYNLPATGDNLLAKIEFTPEEVYYSNGKPMEEVFWLPVEPKWFNLSSQLVVCYNNNFFVFFHAHNMFSVHFEKVGKFV